MSDPSLFNWTPPAPCQRHSPTSIAAAISIEPRISALHRKLLAFLASCPDGATDEEIQLGLNMNASTERPRRIEAMRYGKLRDSGRTRKTRSGRSAVVWVIA